MASGKSTVGGWLRQAGFTVVDADRVVAELYAPDGAGAAAVRELFGDDVLNAEGGVDHPRVAEILFSDPGARRRVEERIHPLVRQRFREIAEASGGVVVLEAALLVEAGYVPDFDLVVTVESPADDQLRRGVARGMEEAAVRARLNAQGDGEERRQGAHRILTNDGTLDELRLEVDELVATIKDPP
jgi:dephospho-CoA kinase